MIEVPQLDPLLSWLLRCALALLFATAAVHKLRDPRDFRTTLADYEILPPAFVGLGVGALVAAESVVAMMLLLIGGATAGLASLALLALYSFAIGLNLLRGRRQIDCGCLGPAFRQPLSAGLILRNAILGLGAAAAALPVSARSLHAIDAVSLGFGLVTLVLLFHSVQILAAQTGSWADRENVS